jgi:hypothetical protein
MVLAIPLARVAAGRVVALLVAGALGSAQGRRGGRFGYAVPMATPESFDGAFHFCRLGLQVRVWQMAVSWSVDSCAPTSTFRSACRELTKTRVSFDAGARVAAPGRAPD